MYPAPNAGLITSKHRFKIAQNTPLAIRHGRAEQYLFSKCTDRIRVITAGGPQVL
jgi:hypothetical protein